jgi:hypothetical protein
MLLDLFRGGGGGGNYSHRETYRNFQRFQKVPQTFMALHCVCGFRYFRIPEL